LNRQSREWKSFGDFYIIGFFSIKENWTGALKKGLESVKIGTISFATGVRKECKICSSCGYTFNEFFKVYPACGKKCGTQQ